MMTSLLFNKKTLAIMSLVLPLILSNYTIAELDLSIENVVISNRHADNVYFRDDSLRVSCTVRSNGDEPLNYFHVHFYAGDYYIGACAVSRLEPGSVSEDERASCIISTTIPYGTYTVWGKILVDDNNPDNNTAFASPDIIIKEKPPPPPVVDLRVYDVWIPHGTSVFHQGEEISFACEIENNGNTTSDSYNINFSLGSYLIGSISRNPLGHGESDRIDETDPFIIPLDIPDGYYYVWAEAVYPDDNYSNDNKEHSDSRIRLVTRYSEIALTDLETVGSDFKQGGPIRVHTSISASGYLTAENICVEYYIDEYLIGSTDRDDLEPGETEDFTTECQIPEDLPDGDYTMRAIVSCTDDKNPGNNEMDLGSWFYVGPIADLEVKAVQGARGIFMPKEMISVYSLVENIGDANSNVYTVDYYLSKDTHITAGDYHLGQVKRNVLEPGGQHSYNTTFQIPPNVPVDDYYVGIIVKCYGDKTSANNSGSDNETFTLIHPPNYVCGRVRYEFPNFDNQPVRYAFLKVYDKNNSTSDRVIGQTYTDQNGNYGVVVLNDANSAYNIYTKVFTYSVSGVYPGTTGKICSVRDDVLKQLYSFQSQSFSHPRDSSQTINMTMPVKWRPFIVFDSIVEAFHQAKTFFNVEMEETLAYWPSADNGTYYYPSHGIWIARDNECDRDVILHEYGHFIAEVYKFAQGDVGENPIHTWNRDLRDFPVFRTAEHAANLAFREAWPTFFSIASQLDDPEYPNSGDTKYQDYDSHYHWTFQFDLEEDTFDSRWPGEYYENMNCCSLWDIFDDHRELHFPERVTDPNLARIWTVMRGYRPEDMNDFWIGWYQSYGQDDDIEGVIDIFQQHKMTFADSNQAPALPQNQAPVAMPGEDMLVLQDRAEGAQVHLDASASYDPDEDELTYIWRYGCQQYSGVQVDIILPVGISELELEVFDGRITVWDTVSVTVVPTSPETW